MDKTRNLYLISNSEGEKYFNTTILPICEDKVSCVLGAPYGLDFNTYKITDEDYFRVRPYLTKRNWA